MHESSLATEIAVGMGLFIFLFQERPLFYQRTMQSDGRQKLEIDWAPRDNSSDFKIR